MNYPQSAAVVRVVLHSRFVDLSGSTFRNVTNENVYATAWLPVWLATHDSMLHLFARHLEIPPSSNVMMMMMVMMSIMVAAGMMMH